MRKHLPSGGRPLIAVLTALFCVSLVLLIAIPIRMSTNALDAQAEERVDDVAMTSAIAVERQLSAVTALTTTYVHTLEGPLASGASLDDPAGEVRRELTELQRSNGDIGNIGLLDPAGLIVANQPWRAEAIGTTRADRSFFQAALKNSNANVSGVLFARAPGEPHVVVVAQAIYRPNTTEVMAVLATSIDVDSAFQVWVNELHDSNGITATVYDSHGAVVARPGLGNELITSTSEHIVGKQRGQHFVGKESLNGRSTINAYVPISDFNWTVRATVTSHSVLSPVDSMRGRVMTSAFVLVATLLGGLWLLRRVFRERARAQQTLTQTEARMREVIESAEQMFIEIDRDGRITEWNRKAEETLGWNRQEVIGSTVLEVPGFIPDYQRPTVARRLEKLSSTPEDQSWRQRIESVVLRKGTSDAVHVELSMWTTRVGGELRLASLLQDITARKRFEAERENLVKQQNRLVNELRRTDKSKSDFVSTVSHELRTPLTSIVGYLEMLRDGFGGDLTERQTSMLDVVDRNSRRLLSLIEDLLSTLR